MSDADQVNQAIAELWDIVKCRCHEAYTGRGLHDPDCQCDSTDAVKTVAARIEALTEQRDAARQDAKEAEAYAEELEEVIDRQAALLADAYGADLDWEEILKQRADHEAVNRIEALEAKLSICEKYRDAYDEMGRIGTQAVRDLEAKLAKAVEVLNALDATLDRNGWHVDSIAREDIRTTLAQIKGADHD